MNSASTRRKFLRNSVIVGTGVILSGCGGGNMANEGTGNESSAKAEREGEVSATEDLMREHGVLRRALLVYSAAAIKLRAKPETVEPGALQRNAKLFRTFGEE